MTTATSTASSLRRLPVALGLGLTLAAGLVTTSAGSVAAAGTTVTPSGPVSIVSNNYASSDYDPVTIPAVGPSTPNPTSLDVDGVPGTITDVDVVVRSLSHTFPADLDLMLVGPGGQRVLLMSDAGSSFAVSDVNLGFDDEAPTGLPQFSGLADGFFRPTNFGSGRRPVPGAGSRPLRCRVGPVGVRRDERQRDLAAVRGRRHRPGQRRDRAGLGAPVRDHGRLRPRTRRE